MGIKLLGADESMEFFNKNVPDDVKAMLALVGVTVYCGHFFYDVFLGEHADSHTCNGNNRLYNMKPSYVMFMDRLNEIVRWTRDGMKTCDEEGYGTY